MQRFSCPLPSRIQPSFSCLPCPLRQSATIPYVPRSFCLPLICSLTLTQAREKRSGASAVGASGQALRRGAPNRVSVLFAKHVFLTYRLFCHTVHACSVSNNKWECLSARAAHAQLRLSVWPLVLLSSEKTLDCLSYGMLNQIITCIDVYLACTATGVSQV